LPLFLVFRAFLFVRFKEKRLHFAPFSLSSLVASPLLFTPDYPLLAPKTHFLMPILPFGVMLLTALKGFVYTVSVDIYAFRLAFSTILHCV